MKSMLRASSALTIAGLSLILGAAPALAQDAAAAADEVAESTEIVVTAQKREENLQEVPLAISVVGGEALANSGSLTLENAQYLVPSLNFRKAGTTLNQALFLRGVGTINFSIAAEPSVAAVLDGVVLSRAGEGFTDLFDVERIEVLRGPQGTLFGKNASAGVVSIVTKRPSKDFEGTVEASWGEGNELRGRATVNLPMGDSLRSRFPPDQGRTFPGQADPFKRGIMPSPKASGGLPSSGIRGPDCGVVVGRPETREIRLALSH